MKLEVLNERRETFRDACQQAAVHGETALLRSLAHACRDAVTKSASRDVVDAASGSVYLPRLERDYVQLWGAE